MAFEPSPSFGLNRPPLYRDFMDLDNPLLAWMLDYDAVSTCLRVSSPGGLDISGIHEMHTPFPHLSNPAASSPMAQFVPHLKSLKQEQMEQILDRFDAREEVYESEVIINQGDLVRSPRHASPRS